MNRENNYKLKVISLTDDALVTHAPTTVTAYLRPGVGFVYEIISIFGQWNTPAGSSAGTHGIEIFPTNREAANDEHITLSTAFGNQMTIRSSIGFTADSEFPAGTDQQYKMIHRTLVCSYDEPLSINYTNSTDADQTGTRYLVFTVKEYREAI